MTNQKRYITQVKALLTEAIFLVTNTENAKETHAKLVECLILASKLEDIIPESTSHTNQLDKSIETVKTRNEHYKRKDNSIEHSMTIVQEEVKKVTRRLRRWKANPSQYNSMILNAFLTLQIKGEKKISVNMLERCFFKAVQESKSPMVASNIKLVFNTNYSQMKNIADRNHGKVFDEVDGLVSIWEPVQGVINELWNLE